MTAARSFRCWFLTGTVFACLFLCLTDDTAAQKKDEPKGKSDIVKIDLSTLPPRLAAQVREFALDEPEAKDRKDGKAKDPKGKGKDKERPKGKGKGEPKTKDKGKKESKKKEHERVISLSEAIGIAQRSGRGEAVKAERKGKDGEIHFKVELRTANGEKTKLELDGHGRIFEPRGTDEVLPQPTPELKKKGKGKDK